MTRAYDLVVVGSGTAAQVASHRMAAAGWKVAVIDHRPFGGTCALRGCDPKRMLLTGAEVIDDIARMSRHGIVAKDARVTWPELMAFKRSYSRPIPANGRSATGRKGSTVSMERRGSQDRTRSKSMAKGVWKPCTS